jgi:hypothetical protein
MTTTATQPTKNRVYIGMQAIKFYFIILFFQIRNGAQSNGIQEQE